MEKALVAAKEKLSMHKPKFGNKRGKCFNCGLKGHFARDCRKPKKSNEKHEQQTNFTETTDNKNALFWGSSNTNSDECFVSYIDSGASQHMSCNKNWMKNYNEFSVPEKVRLGDNRTVEALGKGTVWLGVMAEGQYKPVELSVVLYVPSLAKNLFSVRAVVDKDLTVIFKDDQCIILNKSGNVMGSGKKDGKLFILDCKMMDNQSHQVHSAIGEKKKTNDQHAETPVISQPDICIDNSEPETEDEETVADMQIDPGANGEDNQNAENVVISLFFGHNPGQSGQSASGKDSKVLKRTENDLFLHFPSIERRALHEPQGHVPDTNSVNTNFQTPRINQEFQSVSAEPHQTASQTTTKAKKTKKPRTEWTEEQSGYLLQLWADHKDYIDSAHSRKAWKRLREKFVKRFTVNYHVDKYKEVSDWNKKQSGGHTRECEFFDIIENVLGTSDMVTFKDVESAGFTEKEDPFIVNSGASSSFQILGREEESAEEDGD
eukprot:gene6744-7504_t